MQSRISRLYIYDGRIYRQSKKENNYEYILGEYKVGRYAWILQNVQEIDQKIQAKGKLNIWTYPESSNHVKQLSLFEK